MSKDFINDLKGDLPQKDQLIYEEGTLQAESLPEDLNATREYSMGNGGETEGFYELPPDIPDESPAWASELPVYQELPLAQLTALPENLPAMQDMAGHKPLEASVDMESSIAVSNKSEFSAPGWGDAVSEFPPTTDFAPEHTDSLGEVELPPMQAMLDTAMPPESMLAAEYEGVETVTVQAEDEVEDISLPPPLLGEAISSPETYALTDEEAVLEYLPQEVAADEVEDDSSLVVAESSVVAEEVIEQEMVLETEPTYAYSEDTGASLDEMIAAIDSEMAHTTIPASMVDRDLDPSRIPKHRYIILSLANTKSAIPIENIVEIGHIPRITTVPNVPRWIAGVTNMRGDILSVIDFRTFLGIAPLEQTDIGRMLIVRSKRNELITGLIVDEVCEMRDLADDEIVPPAKIINNKVTALLQGLHGQGNELVIIFDIERLLSLPELYQFQAI